MSRQIRQSTVIASATAVLFCICAWGQAPAVKQDKCFLWKVKSDTTTAYLMGSMHLAKQEIYPLNTTIEKAFEQSDILVVEINMTPEATAKGERLAREKGVYNEGQTLESELSPDTLTKLKDYLAKNGASLAAMNMIRPWFLVQVLANGELMRLGYDRKLGVDEHFRKKATGKKPIKELETIEEQLGVLSSASAELQELLLINTLDDMSETETLMKRLVEAWEKGDPDKLDKTMQKTLSENPKLKPFYKKVFDDRNVKMTGKIEEYLKTDKTHFVVVGCGHLAGKSSIVSLLKQKNKYTIEQLSKVPVKAAKQPAKVEVAP